MTVFGTALTKLWPHGDSKIPGLVAATIAAAPAIFAKYKLDTDGVIAQAMAQFSHECNGGVEIVENLNYRAEQLLRQWPKHFTPAQAIAMQHKPRLIADQAYNGRMGNRVGTDDGWNYRGRGLAQTTGRNGYAALGKLLGLDLVDNPDLVNDSEHFLECGVANFVQDGCLPFARADDVLRVTRKLNGGTIGLSSRKHWLVLWKHAMGVS